MNNYKNHSRKIIVTASDIFIIILIGVPFAFISLRAALFTGAIITSLIVIRRTIQHRKQAHVNGFRILNVKNKLTTSQKVAVFELSDSAAMGILYKYIEVLRMMAIRPKILVIRFRRILLINPDEAHILNEVIARLSAEETKIFFSDVDVNLKKQLKKFDLVQKVGNDNVFHTIDEALNCAEKMFNTQ